MDGLHHEEMIQSINKLMINGELVDVDVYLFGHCEATICLLNELWNRCIFPIAILDNSDSKQGITIKNVWVCKPNEIMCKNSKKSIVLIASRFYESMRAQLIELGYSGQIEKIIDYNTYSEYSFSKKVIKQKKERVDYGKKLVERLRNANTALFLFFCPFQALGDVYFCMSYIPMFLRMREIEHAKVCVVGKACKKVAELFDNTICEIEEVNQYDMDAMIQASLYSGDKNTFIAHQDRPYVISLHKALYIKCISLEKIYCCGVFGLPYDSKPVEATKWKTYDGKVKLDRGNTVVLSPYAKSVTLLPDRLWIRISLFFQERGYSVVTNVVGDEKPIPGTTAITADLDQMKNVLELAGVFVGIRSGLCDVIRTAKCTKIAIYPDYNYCDTKWKAIDMYGLADFKNVVYAGNDDFVIDMIKSI